MSDSSKNAIGVIGAGSWGTALSILIAGNGYRVALWGNEPEHIRSMQSSRQNQRYLPDIAFPEMLDPQVDFEKVVSESSDLLIAVPSRAFHLVLQRLAPLIKSDARISWATKGLQPDTAMPLHEVASKILGNSHSFATISGPTFAMEVAHGLPTAVTVASHDQAFATDLATLLHNNRFRVYLSDDPAGVGIAGTMKNVYAIAAGIADGLGFGANTRAALITRGLAEIMRLGIAMGGRTETFMGLAGLGDLTLTCTDNQSRNRRFGMALAQGLTVKEALASIDQVVEGMGTAKEVMTLSQRYDVHLPICEQVYNVIYNGVSPEKAVEVLLAREDAHNEIS